MARVRILLAEDDEEDYEFFAQDLKALCGGCELIRAANGEEALEWLSREIPDLVILDKYMPKKDGREVLAEIKADKCLMKIPVVVLTTSTAEEDIARAYSAHANCYITKPVDLDQFLRVVNTIETFWLTLVKLPSR
jgi:CheY-like chemotaxis protein